MAIITRVRRRLVAGSVLKLSGYSQKYGI